MGKSKVILISILFCSIFKCANAVNVSTQTEWNNAISNYIAGKDVTINLISDFEIGSFTIPDNGNNHTLTINGNGHKITVNGKVVFNQPGQAILNCEMAITGDFTLQGGAVKVTATSDSKIVVGGATSLGSATFTTFGKFDSSTLNISGGGVDFTVGMQVVGKDTVQGFATIGTIDVSSSALMHVNGKLKTEYLNLSNSGGDFALTIGNGGVIGVEKDMSATSTSGMSIGGSGILGVGGNVNFSNANINMDSGSQMYVDGKMDIKSWGSKIYGELSVQGILNTYYTEKSGFQTNETTSHIYAYELYCDYNGSNVSDANGNCANKLGLSSKNLFKGVNNDYYNPVPELLPIVLSAFTASAQTNSVNVYWTTESEQNNDYFTIYRSADGEIFEEIGTVAGAGNSTYTINYSFTDYYPLDGISYYMLKQTDYNGEFKFSDKVFVKITDMESAMQAVKVYPNPYKNEGLTIDLGTASNSNVQVSISTVAGKVLSSISCHTSSPIFRLAPHLNAGVYVVTVTVDGQSQMQKLVVE